MMDEQQERRAFSVIHKALHDHEPVSVLALFSGGHDSLTATSVAMRSGLATAVAHIDTGTGVPESSEFVEKVCEDEGWPLKVYRPPLDEETGKRGAQYEWIVRNYGMPGPGAHGMCYQWLKERALRKIIRDHKTKRMQRVALITGVRSQESTRRMGHVEPIQRLGAWVWIAPIHDWTKLDCTDYIKAIGLPRSPVVDLIHMSGECLCGAFARDGELQEIEMWFPGTAERIREFEEIARKNGKPCKWGARPPGAKHRTPPGQLCFSCDGM